MAQSTGDRQDFVFSVMDGSVPNTILRLTILQAWLPHFWPDVRVEKRGGGRVDRWVGGLGGVDSTGGKWRSHVMGIVAPLHPPT